MQKSAVFVISTIGRNLFYVFLRSLVAPLCRDDIFAVFVILNAGRNLKDVLFILLSPLGSCLQRTLAVLVLKAQVNLAFTRLHKVCLYLRGALLVAYNDYCLNLSCRICIFSIIWLKVGLLVP